MKRWLPVASTFNLQRRASTAIVSTVSKDRQLVTSSLATAHAHGRAVGGRPEHPETYTNVLFSQTVLVAVLHRGCGVLPRSEAKQRCRLPVLWPA